jgi:hypothetical protein
MIVPYTRFLSFLVNGLDKSYRDNLYAVKDDLEFTFNEYVLSQMHLAIVSHLLKRDLYAVYRVYRFIEDSREVNRNDVLTVLRWYYHDMSGFFRNIAGCSLLEGISLKVEVPETIFSSLGIDAEEISFEEEKEKVLSALKTGEGKYEQYLNLFYEDIGIVFENAEQENRYVMAILLLYFSKQNKFIRWRENK